MAGYKGIYLFYIIKTMANAATLKTFLLNGKLESLLGYGLNPPTRISSLKIPPRIFPKPLFKNGGNDNATHQSTIIHRPSEDNSGVQNGQGLVDKRKAQLAVQTVILPVLTAPVITPPSAPIFRKDGKEKRVYFDAESGTSESEIEFFDGEQGEDK